MHFEKSKVHVNHIILGQQCINWWVCWNVDLLRGVKIPLNPPPYTGPPIPRTRPSTEPKYSLAYHFRDEGMNTQECIPPVCGRSYYLPQLISNWNKNKEVIPWNKEIGEQNYGNKLKNYEKQFMCSKALKIHEFPFNATKTAQRRHQAPASWKLETTIVSLVQKRIPLCQSLGVGRSPFMMEILATESPPIFL